MMRHVGKGPPHQRKPHRCRRGHGITAKTSGQSLLMGWSGRAPAPPVTNLARGSKDKGARYVPEPQQRNRRDRHRYRQKLIPCRKLDDRGAIALRQKWSRGQIEVRLANMPPCLIGMEACVGAHHLSRVRERLVSQRTGIINQIRAFLLERGMPVTKSLGCPPRSARR